MAAAAYRQFNQDNLKKDEHKIALEITNALTKINEASKPQTRINILKKISSVLKHYISSFEGLNNFHEIYSFYYIWIESIIKEQEFHKIAFQTYQVNKETYN